MTKCTLILLQGETELSFRLIPSLTRSHTKPRTKTVGEEDIVAKEGISLKDNSVSPCNKIKVHLVIDYLQFDTTLFVPN